MPEIATTRTLPVPTSPAGSDQRAECPVFVVGCHRSGTNLLYDNLLSSGAFAVYRGYLPVHKILIPRIGQLDNLENRKKALDLWLRSKGFRRSGLDAHAISDLILSDCRSGGDFIRIVMDSIAEKQNLRRWAVYDPDAIFHMASIKAEIPRALFVHIVRDGRDIAVSLNKMGGFMPFFWHRKPASVLATAAYWEWTVRKAHDNGRQFPDDYLQIHYEDLVRTPQVTLAALGKFLGADLDYQRIQEAGLGRVSESNSSFREEPKEVQQSPVGRWRNRLSRQEVAELEQLIGDCLEEFGYQLTIPEKERAQSPRHRLIKTFYPAFLSSKLWLRTRTPVGRFANLSALELQDEIPDAATSPGP